MKEPQLTSLEAIFVYNETGVIVTVLKIDDLNFLGGALVQEIASG